MEASARWRVCARWAVLALGLGALLFAGSSAGDVVAQEQPVRIDMTQVNPYYAVGTTTVGGEILGKVVISGPPDPPEGPARVTVNLPLPSEDGAVNSLSNHPAFDWSYGCSATSAAMIAGYYDRTSYPNMYAGPTNGGVMPLDNSTWGYTNWPRYDGQPGTMNVAECPLSATHNGIDGRSTRGHVDDYWYGYGHTGPDPFVDNGWTEHTIGDCTGDYMRTNQASSPYFNSDGSTSFYYYPSGAKYTGTNADDGGYGFELFCNSRGYTVEDRYNRILLGYDWDGSGTTYGPATQGAVFADYKAEIDAGRPVFIHVEGHTMVGVGYDDSTSPETVYLHDTWDYSVHTMDWGGYYSAMLHMGITVLELSGPEIDVQGLGTSIADGDTTPSTSDDTDYGTVSIGNDHTHTFTVYNTGTDTLTLDGSPRVQVTGSSDFTVTSQPSATVAASGSTTFQVRFSPSGAGLRTATLTIDNNDLNEDPYNFSIQGTGSSPSDTTPPTPDPMTWNSAPNPTGMTTISMTATTATDPSGVEYFFDETSGNPGGTDSGWQDSTDYSDDGLQADTQYCYRVRARDKSVNQNTTDWSSTSCASTSSADTAATFRVTSAGTVLADGTLYSASLATGAADVGEWVSVSEPVTAGSVVELDPTNPGSYRLSSVACSTWVAGVISTEPGMILGRSEAFEERAVLALVGIIPTYVTDEGGPILPGDLLVASSTSGYAMRWSGSEPCPCALVGKALEPMTGESGLILVLLTAH
jgi:hypothetical protein